MNLQQLKEEVLSANLDLVKNNLVISTWGNASGYDEDSALVVIKASGISYDIMNLEHMIVVDLDGNVIQGKYAPSTDTPTHLMLYKEFSDKGIHSIVHTHSQYATIWAQQGMDIPSFGTTHCDYFYGDIPCTRLMRPDEIETEYEKNTAKVIIERFKNLNYKELHAVLVHSHGPFVWGKTPSDASLHGLILEYIAKMAFENYIMSNDKIIRVQPEIMAKHYKRKWALKN